ncbi:hypothetical protein AYO37_01150 [Opitutia bacterium SCGC AG-212-L18]|nr:hypothetical protein AYO37_01150 [Opitutae bacterium SCGC AG-212-L18]
MAFSAYAMMFADRMILSRYSVEVMNASVVAGAIYGAFMFSLLSLALIAEVFVGQYNGSGQLNKIGRPVWQMVWFSLMTILVFWPAGLFLGDLFLVKEATKAGIPYFKGIMLFGPAVPMIGALGAFNVGRGKTLAVTLIVAGANIMNVILGIIMVFGIEGVFPAMGGKGAAIAMGISQLMQVVVLFMIFLNKKNRHRYGTGDFRFNKTEFYKCIKVGAPNAIAFGIGIASWAFFNDLVAGTGAAYMTALAICQNYFFLFYFITEGMGKAVTTITANMIGAKKHEMVEKLLRSAMKMHLIFIALLAIPLIFYSAPLIDLFLRNNPTAENIVGLYEMADSALTWIWVTILFNGFFWIFMSQLTAAGDTKFIMYLNMVSGWTLMVMPAYVFIKLFGYSPTLSWKIMVVNVIVLSLCVFLRFRSGKWRQFNLID